MSKKFLLLMGIFSLLAVLPVSAQSLPTVDVWVTVRDAATLEEIVDAQVENTLCADLPAEVCTASGAYDADRQAFVMTVPRLEPYEIVVRKAGYGTVVKQGTALEPQIVLTVWLVPQEGQPALNRVFLPLVLAEGTAVTPPPYNPSAAVARLNVWRALAGLPAVQGDPELHSGCRAHARYMAQGGVLAHVEDPNLPGYTLEGDSCGQAGNVALGFGMYPTDEALVDALMVSPFHALNALEPRLTVIGFGSYRHADPLGGFSTGAALDVFHGVDYGQSVSAFTFPQNGMILPVYAYNGKAQPDPLTACPGYTAPTGQALVVAFGEGSVQVERSALTNGRGENVTHCVITAGSYVNPNAEIQQQGRSALYARGAVLIIPRQPLEASQVYALDVELSDGRSAGMLFYTATAQALPDMWVLSAHGD